MDTFTDIIIIATLSALIPYALSAAAQLYLFIGDRASFSGVVLMRHSIIAVLALAYSSWAIWGAGADAVRKGAMLLLAGIPVYLWVRWRESREVPPAGPPIEPDRATAETPLEVA